jgi:hypothetical protein
MFLRIAATFLCVASAGLFCGEKNNPVTVPAGPTELEGVWTGYSDADNAPLPRLTYTFVNNTVVVQRDTCTSQGFAPCDVELYRGTFVADTSASPKTIDIHITQSSVPAWVGTTLYAIYFKFANNVNMSANASGSARPVSASPPTVDPPIIHLGQ